MSEAPSPSRRLKLRAQDDEDLQILSACLQDALVPLGDMLYEPSAGRFAMVVNRFMWEAPPERRADGDAVHARIHGILSVHEVTGVQLRGIDRSRTKEPLCLLGLQRQGEAIHLEFAGGGTIRVTAAALHVYLEDMGEPWPTVWRPTHPDA
ncbi:MAG: DUF2948 family protein [Alphaproteobacteria bacterium]